MKIKMLTSISGLDFDVKPGEITDRFSAEEAWRLVNAGYAEPIEVAETERAVAPVVGIETRKRRKGAA